MNVELCIADIFVSIEEFVLFLVSFMRTVTIHALHVFPKNETDIFMLMLIRRCAIWVN